MTVDKDDAAASDAAQRAILRTQNGYITRLVGEKSELIDQVEGIQAERDAYKARAEAAEARTAPAVTKAEIEKVIRGQWGGCFDGLTDAVWSLVSGDDPAVFVVRESDIAAVKVEQDGEGDWEVGGDLVAMRQNTAEALRGWSLGELQMLARYEAVARAIEAGTEEGQ